MLDTVKPLLKRIYHALRAVLEVRTRVRGSGNSWSFGRCVLRKVVLDIQGNGNRVTIADGCVVEGLHVQIRGDNHRLEIGPRSWIKDTTMVFEDTGCRILLAEEVKMVSVRLSAVEDNQTISLGRQTGIADGGDLRTSDSHSIVDLASGKRLNPPGSIHLGEHVWVGCNVTILKGVRIGDNCIVGTGSVVTRDIPENCLVAGMPAKVLRTGVTWAWDKLPS